jgi:hypothetical protein
MAAVFGALSEVLRDPGENEFRTLAAEYATAGGLNEQFLGALRSAGTFKVVENALDEVAHRLESE